MIRYSLTCKDGHQFESWFQSAAAFEKLIGSRLLSCAVCGGADVTKSLMAPSLGAAADAPARSRPLSTPASAAEQALAELKKKIEATSDYVGGDFATEARAIHEGEAPARSIYGEARPVDARKLIEDGIPVAPLPFTPGRKSN